jgi:hypothetical protein
MTLNFKLYGNARGEAQFVELETASLCFQSWQDANRFAEFARHCADLMKSMGASYDHEHLIDFDAAQNDRYPDITIERLIDTSRN